MGILLKARAADQPGERNVGSGVTQLAESDHVLGADTHRIAGTRDLVREGEANIARRVVDQLDHLRGFGVRDTNDGARQAAEERCCGVRALGGEAADDLRQNGKLRSEEHTSELQSLMRTSYAVFCLKKKNKLTTR